MNLDLLPDPNNNNNNTELHLLCIVLVRTYRLVSNVRGAEQSSRPNVAALIIHASNASLG